MVTYILGDKNNPIDLGLFQTIVKIDFPSNGDYVRYTVSAQSGKNNSVTPPPVPVLSVTLGDLKPIDIRRKIIKKVNPAQHGTIRFFYLWWDLAPTPVNLDQFGELVAPGGGTGAGFITYGGQFDFEYQVLDAEQRQAGFPGLPPLNLGTSASASVCAAAFNAKPSGVRPDWYYAAGGFNHKIFPGTNMLLNVHEWDEPVDRPASATTQITATYLFKLPKLKPGETRQGPTSITVSTDTGVVGGTQLLDVALFQDVFVKKMTLNLLDQLIASGRVGPSAQTGVSDQNSFIADVNVGTNPRLLTVEKRVGGGGGGGAH